MKTPTTLPKHLTAPLLVCAVTFVAMAPLQAALVARLSFDDAANLNADSSGNANHATIGGSPSATAGIAGGAVSFDGTSYLKWEGSGSPVVQVLDGSFTVCVWVKTTQTFALDGSNPWEGAGLVWADYPGAPPVGDAIPLALTGSKAAGFANSPTLHSTTSINSGQWIHLAFVRYAHATSGYVRLFVNGQPEATDLSNGASVSDAQIVAVAANLLDGRYYVGLMDDLRLYNTALSESEILSVYDTQVEWSDDFSAGLNPDIWEVNSNQPLYSLVATQGELRVSKPYDGRSDFQFIDVAFARQIEGDFEAQVDFRDAQTTRVNGSPGNQVQLNAVMGGVAFCVVRSDEAGPGNNAHIWRSPPGAWFGERPSTVANGTFRIQRIGSTVSGYLDDVLIYSSVCNASTVTHLSFPLQNNGTSDATAVSFDNFRLKARRLVPVPPRLSLSVVGATRHIEAQRLTPGCHCILERATSLAPDAVWEAIATWTTAGVTDAITDLQPSVAFAYYRLRTQ
jgi:hypothetical protein